MKSNYVIVVTKYIF
jgi:hypothetical protein